MDACKLKFRRKWQLTPVFLPGKSHGRRSLVGYSPWDCKSQTRLSNWTAFKGFPGDSVVKNSSVSAEDSGSVSGSGRSPGEGNGYPLQYSCLKNPMDRWGCWAVVHGVTKESDTTEWLNNNDGDKLKFKSLVNHLLAER